MQVHATLHYEGSIQPGSQCKHYNHVLATTCSTELHTGAHDLTHAPGSVSICGKDWFLLLLMLFGSVLLSYLFLWKLSDATVLQTLIFGIYFTVSQSTWLITHYLGVLGGQPCTTQYLTYQRSLQSVQVWSEIVVEVQRGMSQQRKTSAKCTVSHQ